MAPQYDAKVQDLMQNLLQIQGWAKRYMEAVYGPSVWFMAPEAIPNVLERWLKAVAQGDWEAAETHMSRIEQMAAKGRE